VGIIGRQKLIDEKGRNIIDGGLSDCIPIFPENN
jgi:predicted patatin/cPLA2 family phospholipase